MNTTPPNTSQTAQTRHGVILTLAAVMPAMAIISLVPVLPLLTQEFASVEGVEFLVPIAMTIPALCVALFSPIAGLLSDKTGRKSLLIMSLIIYAVIGLVPFFLTELPHIIMTRVVLGIAEAVIMTVATALIGDYFQGKARERWVAIQIASVSLSAIILIAVGGLLGEVLGSRGPFLLYLLALPIALLCAIVLFEPVKHLRTAVSHSAKFPIKTVLPLLFTTLFVGLIFYTIIVKLGVILQLVGDVSPAVIGGIGAAANIGVALGSVTFSKLKGASGPKLVCIGLLLATLGYVGASLSISLLVTSASLFVACFGCGMLLPTMLTWILSLLPDNVRGRGTGLWTGVFFFGQFAAPIAVAALQNKMGSLEAVLMLIAGLSLIGAAIAASRLKGAKGLVSH
ncbi:MFS transporter [Flavobacterium sp. W21_SRS_FM6]|uniref:MFS transporter n=1 Tax=Flavobacterium sp. W21_SRS_FM6 TaxID=3240268 RepID=UPI003F9296B7